MKTKPLYLIYLQTILFSIFLLITSYFNRFAIDDFHFIGELQTTSFTNIYKHLYFDWHGRWASNFLLIGFLKFNTFPFFLALYNIFSISLLYLGIVRLFNSLNHFYQLNFNKKTILLYSIIAISVLFFCTINASDVWMWYTSSIVYLWSTIALFWGTTIFFKHKKIFIDFAILIISAIYIGGSNEPLTIFIIISLLILLLKKRKKTISVISLFFTLSAFLINYLSPGTLHRDEITPSLSFIDLMLYTGYGSIKFLLFSIYKTFIPALFIAVNFYLLGEKLSKPIFQNFKPLPELIKSLIIIGVTIFLNQIIVIYALGGLAPDRSSITSSIIIAIILIRYLFLLGNYHQKKYTQIKYLLIINIITLIGFNLYYTDIHYNYAKSVDKRILFIKENDTEIIWVKPLPNSGYIYSAEITEDANNFKNQHLKNGLGVKNNIVLITDH